MTARTGINISHSALMTEEGCPLRGYLTTGATLPAQTSP